MKLFPWTKSAPVIPAPEQVVEQKADISLDTLIQRLDAVYRTVSGINVTPETCMQSPTVHAIVTAISRRISIAPLVVMKRSFNDQGREQKERLPAHPVQRLINNPNQWQTRQAFLLDAASSLVRYGRFFAYKVQGNTGPIRRLVPLHASCVDLSQDENWDVTARVSTKGGQREVPLWELLYARGAARDYLNGDSPISDVREAIALEIAMERFGAGFFGNGAMPLLVFKLMQGFQDFKDTNARDAFLSSVKSALGGRNQHSSFMLPKGIEVQEVKIENEKTQFVEARKHQRTVIAGALGVPPHIVGDLERATFNNVEQQDTDFTVNVVLPIAQQIESAMERDLLTQQDRNSGVVIRFNLDAVQRADFKSRQEGLKIQRDAGVINANEWREAEGRNPIAEDDGGEDYIFPANFQVAGEPPAAPPAEPPRQSEDEEPESDEAKRYREAVSSITSISSKLKSTLP